MNSWKIVGIIFLVFGLLVLLGGLFYASTIGAVAQAATDTANSYYNIIPEQTGSIVFMFSFAPFAIGSVVMFIISAIGFMLGRSKKSPQAQMMPPPP